MRLHPVCCAVLVINKDQLRLRLDHSQDSPERPGRKAHSSGWALAALWRSFRWELGEGLGFRRTPKQGLERSGRGSTLVTSYLDITHGSIFKD